MDKLTTTIFRQGHCEECLACSIPQDNNLISSEAFVGDSPDIIDGNRGIEVTSAIADEIENRLNFGLLPKEADYVDMVDYTCTTCEFLSDCKRDRRWDPAVRCRKCKATSWLRDKFIIVPKGSAFYVGGDHPRAIGWSSNKGSLEDILKVVKKKRA